MQHRIVDNFIHQLRAGRDETPAHDPLRQRFQEAIETMTALADGLYKKARAQTDDNLV